MSDRRNGLRPALPAACRAALRELLHGRSTGAGEETRAGRDARAHAAECPDCTARLRAADRLGELVARRPEVPAELRSPVLFERVLEQAVESAEAGPLGQALEAAPVSAPAGGGQPDERLWQGIVAERSELADAVLTRPAAVGEQAIWTRMRRSILEEVGSRARRLPLRWPLLAAGAAAAVLLGLALMSDSPADGTSRQPVIVFTELEHPPDVEFAVLRYGSPR